MKDTDFNKVKDMAITFAYQPVEPLKIDGLGDGALFVSHPFTNSPIRPVPSKDNPSRPVLVNVLQPEGEAAFREFIFASRENYRLSGNHIPKRSEGW